MSMNHDELIAIIQAAKDGKTVQMRSNWGAREWQDCAPDWFSQVPDYRVKPEPPPKPREITMIENGQPVFYREVL